MERVKKVETIRKPSQNKVENHTSKLASTCVSSGFLQPFLQSYTYFPVVTHRKWGLLMPDDT